MKVHNLNLYVQSLKGLSLLERHLLLTVLSVYRNRNPPALSIDKWANRLGVHRASIYRALNTLEGKYLERINRPGRTNLFKPTSRLCAMVYGGSHQRKTATSTTPGPVRRLRDQRPDHAGPVPPKRAATVPGPLARTEKGSHRDSSHAVQPTGPLSEIQRLIMAISEGVSPESGPHEQWEMLIKR